MIRHNKLPRKKNSDTHNTASLVSITYLNSNSTYENAIFARDTVPNTLQAVMTMLGVPFELTIKQKRARVLDKQNTS